MFIKYHKYIQSLSLSCTNKLLRERDENITTTEAAGVWHHKENTALSVAARMINLHEKIADCQPELYYNVQKMHSYNMKSYTHKVQSIRTSHTSCNQNINMVE